MLCSLAVLPYPLSFSVPLVRAMLLRVWVKLCAPAYAISQVGIREPERLLHSINGLSWNCAEIRWLYNVFWSWRSTFAQELFQQHAKHQRQQICNHFRFTPRRVFVLCANMCHIVSQIDMENNRWALTLRINSGIRQHKCHVQNDWNAPNYHRDVHVTNIFIFGGS